MLSSSTLQDYVGDSADVSVLEATERGVVARLERETGRILAAPPALYTETLNGPRPRHGSLRRPPRYTSRLVLRDAPVDLQRVEFLNAGQWVEQDLADFELDGRILRAKRCSLPVGRGTIRVTYLAGYTVDGGPEDAMELVKQLVHWHWQRQKAKGGAIETVKLGSNSISYAKWTEAGFDDAIEALRLPRLPRASS